MLVNFNRYDLILSARKSKKFRELDDQVRVMAYELGKKNPDIDKQKYRELKEKRDKELMAYVTSLKEEVHFDLTTYGKIDTKIKEKIEKYLSKFPNTKKNVVLTGATGTGKTYCAKLIEHQLTQKGFKVHMTSTFNLVKRMKDHLYSQDTSAPYDFFDCDLLIIDDLGAEPTIKNSDELLYTVINERYTNNKSLLVTTNLSKDQIQTRYGDRIFGRIYDKVKSAVIIFNGKDLRIE